MRRSAVVGIPLTPVTLAMNSATNCQHIERHKVCLMLDSLVHSMIMADQTITLTSQHWSGTT